MKWIRWVRWILTILLIVEVYRETGLFTSLAIAMITVYAEWTGYVLSRWMIWTAKLTQEGSEDESVNPEN